MIATQAINLGKINKNNVIQKPFPHFCIDDLLPIEIALKIQDVFPKPYEMVHKKSLREDKFVAAQMNKYNPILEEIIYAFQDKKIVDLVGEICNIDKA